MGVWVRDTVAVGVDACTSFRVPRRTVSSYARKVFLPSCFESRASVEATLGQVPAFGTGRVKGVVSRLHNYLAPGVPMAASRQRGRHLRYSRTRLVVEHPSLPPRSSLVRRRDAKAVWRQWQWHCAPRKQRTTPRKKDGAADN